MSLSESYTENKVLHKFIFYLIKCQTTFGCNSFRLTKVKPFLCYHSSYRFLRVCFRDKSVFWPILAHIIITVHEEPLTFPLVEEQGEVTGQLNKSEQSALTEHRAVDNCSLIKMNVETGGGGC